MRYFDKEQIATKSNQHPVASVAETDFQTRSLLPRVLVLACIVLFVAVLLGVTAYFAFLLGTINGHYRANYYRVVEQTESIEQFLHEHPDRYFAVTVQENSEGYAYMVGSVDSNDDLDLLQSEMQRLFGEELAHTMVVRVHVNPSTDDVER